MGKMFFRDTLFGNSRSWKRSQGSTRNSQALRTPIGKSEAIYQTFTYIGSLAWNYISSKIPTDVSYICFKNYAKLHIQANSLPQIRLNV